MGKTLYTNINKDIDKDSIMELMNKINEESFKAVIFVSGEEDITNTIKNLIKTEYQA